MQVMQHMPPFDDKINSHQKIALQFSGGKDSLACLFMMRPYWDRLTVYWTNTGAAFPETLELMAKVAALVPRFVEINTDQPADIKENGWPVDVLPIRNLPAVNHCYAETRPKLQSFMVCCIRNIMFPMQQRMIEDGITLVIRGQRSAEKHKSILESGDVSNGIEVLFPIENWSGAEVRSYLADKPITLPANYEDMDTSLDCWNCTAYLEDNIGKRRYMKRVHPEAYAVVSEMLGLIAAETEKDMIYLREAMAA